MPDMPLFAFILLGILLFVIAGVAFFFFLYDRRAQYYQYEDDKIINTDHFVCEFRRVGGMENVHTVIRLEYNGGENASLSYSHQPHNGAKTLKKQKTVGKDAVESIQALYKEHCVPIISECPKSEIFALDAPTELASFSSDKDSYIIYADQDFPEKSKGIIYEIEEKLMSFLS